MDQELFKQSYFQLFRQVMFAFLNRATDMLKVYDIHPSQAGLLLYVESHEGQTQKEIANALHVKPPTTATMITRMEKRNFLVRCQDENDRRKSRIFTTEYGREVCDFVKDMVEAGEREMQVVFTEEENQRIKEYMVKMIRYLETAESKSSKSED